MKPLVVFLLSVSAYGQFVSLGGNGQPEFNAPSTPTDSPGMGTYSSTQSVTLADASALAIYYTLTGTAPSCPSTGTLYSGAFNISSTSTLKAIGCNGVTGGGVLTSVYTISGGGGGLGATTNNVTCNVTSANPASCTLPATPTVGNSILLFISTGTDPVTGCTDNQSPANTYTALATVVVGSTDIYIYGAYVATSSGSFKPGCNLTSAFSTANISAGEYTGLGNPITLDAASAGSYNGFASTCASGSLTTTHAADIIFGGMYYASQTATAGAGYTVPSGAGGATGPLAVTEYQVVALATAYNPGFNLGAATNAYCAGVGVY